MVEGKGHIIKTDNGYFILFDESLSSSDFPFPLEPETVMDVRLHIDDKKTGLHVEKYGVNYAAIISEIEELLIKGIYLSTKLQSLDQITKASVAYLKNQLPNLVRGENKEIVEKILANVDVFILKLLEEFERNKNIIKLNIGYRKTDVRGLYTFREKKVGQPSETIISYVERLFSDKEETNVEKISTSEAKMIEVLEVKEIQPKELPTKVEKPPIYIEVNFLANFSKGFHELIEEFGLFPVMDYLKDVGGKPVMMELRVSLDHPSFYTGTHIIKYYPISKSSEYLEREWSGVPWKVRNIDTMTTEERGKYDSICSEKIENLRNILTARRESIIRRVEDIGPIEVTVGALMYLESHKNVRKTELETVSGYSDKVSGSYPSFFQLYNKWLKLGWLKEEGEYVVITPNGSRLLSHLSKI